MTPNLFSFIWYVLKQVVYSAYMWTYHAVMRILSELNIGSPYLPVEYFASLIALLIVSILCAYLLVQIFKAPFFQTGVYMAKVVFVKLLKTIGLLRLWAFLPLTNVPLVITFIVYTGVCFWASFIIIIVQADLPCAFLLEQSAQFFDYKVIQQMHLTMNQEALNPAYVNYLKALGEVVADKNNIWLQNNYERALVDYVNEIIQFENNKQKKGFSFNFTKKPTEPVQTLQEAVRFCESFKKTQ